MEKLNICGVTLNGFAQGGVRTAIHIDECASQFDAGWMLPFSDNHIFITHGHPDHIGALTNIVARRTCSRAHGAPVLKIHVPFDIEPHVFKALDSMEMAFGGKGFRCWKVIGCKPGEVLEAGGTCKVRALRTFHGTATCGWAVERSTMRLKQEFIGKPREELIAAKAAGIAISEENTNIECVIPGDTMIDFLIREPVAQKAKVLLHEVTFWDEQSSVEKCRKFGHTHVDEMIQHCDKFEGEALVLVHRSLKYSRSEAETIMRKRFPAAMLPKIHMFDGGDR